jgi:hypothetical protein
MHWLQFLTVEQLKDFELILSKREMNHDLFMLRFNVNTEVCYQLWKEIYFLNPTL